MISFSSLPVCIGSFTAGIAYACFGIFTTAAQTTANIALSTTDAAVGFVGGPWLQMPFRIVRGIAQPIAEKTVQTAALTVSLTTGVLVGTTVFVGQLWNAPQKLKADPKNEEWVVIPSS